MKQAFPNLVKLALISVYLIFVAGAIVRMTGSGMGCPDWPKCFGLIIPPTEESQIQWKPNHLYQEGQIIVSADSLIFAKENFTTKREYNHNNWEKYTRHDYAIFNAFHTWVEYINRLIGALSGLIMIVMAIVSIKWRKVNLKIPIFSWCLVFLMLFQGWLGAKVVYSELLPFKITLHFLLALVVIALLFYVLHLVNPTNYKIDAKYKPILWVTLIMTLIQVSLGTQVRQFVDHQIDLVGYDFKSLWLENPNLFFYVHRSFSILFIVVNVYLFLRMKKVKAPLNLIYWVFVFIGFEVATGILMNYFDFPFGSQAIHQVIASILFGLQFFMILQHTSIGKNKQSI